MPPIKQFDAVCMVIDVSSASADSSIKDRLEDAVQCASQIIQRKIFAESVDKFSVVLSGTETTSNRLQYSNIQVVSRLTESDKFLSPCDWHLLHFVDNQIMKIPRSTTCDWREAVLVGWDIFKNELCSDVSLRKKCKVFKVILISPNLELKKGEKSGESDDKTFEWTVDSLKGEACEFTFIGETLKKVDDEQIERLISNLSNSFRCSLDTAATHLMYRERRQKKPFPWKTNFLIGNNVNIPIIAYIHSRRERPQMWKKCLLSSTVTTTKCTSYTDLKPVQSFHRKKLKLASDENDTEAFEIDPNPIEDHSDLIWGYRYGYELVSVTDDDMKSLDRIETEKCLKLLCFVDRDKVSRNCFVGDGIMLVQYDPSHKSSQMGLSSLAFAMDKSNVVGLCWRVYRANSAPKLNLLFTEWSIMEDLSNDAHDQSMSSQTEIEVEEKMGLYLVEVPYAEGLRHLPFTQIYNSGGGKRGQGDGDHEDKKKEESSSPTTVIHRTDRDFYPSECQLSTVDGIVSNLMLTNKSRTRDLLPTHTLLNPGVQHEYNCLAKRASNATLNNSNGDMDGSLPFDESEIASYFNVREGFQRPKELRDRLSEDFETKFRAVFPTKIQMVKK